MTPRGILLSATLLVLAIGGLAWFAVSQGRICAAIGYINTSDIELQFHGEPLTVSACFGRDCTPAPISRNSDGRWLVPQRAPYLISDPDIRRGALPGILEVVTVRASYSEGHTTTQSLQISRKSPDAGWWSQCPGPFTYLPVQVP